MYCEKCGSNLEPKNLKFCKLCDRTLEHRHVRMVRREWEEGDLAKGVMMILPGPYVIDPKVLKYISETEVGKYLVFEDIKPHVKGALLVSNAVEQAALLKFKLPRDTICMLNCL
ncbi:MAG: hypothetical protein CMJ20_06835 [Phycisphaeraceae bacterium]|nr:hypothetical protein [Phycisphaeraceae bacterium]